MAGPAERTPLAAPREPIIRAPAAVSLLIGALLLAHAARVLLGVSTDPFAVTRSDLAHHVWSQLITYQFVHGGWAHVLMNCAFILAFGAPVATWLGAGPRGAAVFLAFFLVCGVIAALGYGAFVAAAARVMGVREGQWALVGASGAASGLMGSAARLMQGHGRLGPIRGRLVAGMTVSWIAINIVLGATGLTPGAGQIPVAWEAHIIGYFAGLFLIGAFGRLGGASRPWRG